MQDAVLALLRGLRPGEAASLPIDDRTSTFIESICEHVMRLGIDHLDTAGSSGPSNLSTWPFRR